MSFVAVAVAGGAVAGIAGGVVSSNAAKSAAKTQAGAAQDANATQVAMFNASRADLAPYRYAGGVALADLEQVANQPLSMRPYTPTAPFDPSGDAYTPTPVYQGPSEADLRADSGYQFRVSEGQKALERSAAGKGLLLSGGQLKDLSRFSQGQAAQEYGAVYQRGYQRNQDVYGRSLASNQLAYGRDYQANADLYNRNLQAYQTDFNTMLGLRKERYGEYAGLAGVGQGAVNTLSSLGQTTATALNANTIGAGNALAAGDVGAGNAINAGLGSVGQAGQSYLQYQLLKSLANRNRGNPYGNVSVGSPETIDLYDNG